VILLYHLRGDSSQDADFGSLAGTGYCPDCQDENYTAQDRAMCRWRDCEFNLAAKTSVFHCQSIDCGLHLPSNGSVCQGRNGQIPTRLGENGDSNVIAGLINSSNPD